MVVQYPHSIQISTSNWATGEKPLLTYKGRAELGADARRGFNQENVSVSCIIYMPIPVETIQLDTPVEVYLGTELVVSGAVKQFSRGQLNARIWL